MLLTHDLARRVTTLAADAKLHRGRGELLIVKLTSNFADATLEEGAGAELILTIKPKGIRETSRIAIVTLTEEDWHAASATYRKTFSTLTEPCNALLKLDDDSTNDLASVVVQGNLVHIPVADDPPEIGDTFEFTLENTTYDEDDATPDVLPTADDDWVAHGHEQELTTEQQAQARANIGAVAFSSGSAAPSGGANGDWYLRTTNLHLYTRSAGTWTAIGQLVPVA